MLLEVYYFELSRDYNSTLRLLRFTRIDNCLGVIANGVKQSRFITPISEPPQKHVAHHILKF